LAEMQASGKDVVRTEPCECRRPVSHPGIVRRSRVGAPFATTPPRRSRRRPEDVVTYHEMMNIYAQTAGRRVARVVDHPRPRRRRNAVRSARLVPPARPIRSRLLVCGRAIPQVHLPAPRGADHRSECLSSGGHVPVRIGRSRARHPLDVRYYLPAEPRARKGTVCDPGS
jgi:hypothetical protein